MMARNSPTAADCPPLQFAELLRKLDAPLGLKGQGKTTEEALEFIASLPGLSVSACAETSSYLCDGCDALFSTQLSSDAYVPCRCAVQAGEDESLVYYHEALQALTAHVMGVAISEIDEAVKDELEEEVRRWPCRLKSVGAGAHRSIG